MTYRSLLTRPLGLTFLCFALASCGSVTNHSPDFQCDAAIPGSPCTTIAQADGQGGASHRANVVPVNGNTVTPSRQQQNAGVFYNPGKVNNPGLSNPERPGASGRNLPASRYNARAQRIPERLGTLWVASYLDNDNILHDASYVHFVIQEAGWNGVR